MSDDLKKRIKALEARMTRQEHRDQPGAKIVPHRGDYTIKRTDVGGYVAGSAMKEPGRKK